MKCTSPQWYNGYQVPCGRCGACRVSRTQEWSLRLNHEADEWPSTVFITLTYKPECLPPNGTLVKKHVSDFIKRYRSRIEPRRIKYYACGEYGTNLLRPHYHIIGYGIYLSDCSVVESCWPYGFIKILPFIGSATGNYVAGYVQKKLYGQDAKEYESRGVVAPFSLMSKNLGASYVEKHGEQLLKDLYLSVEGIPRAIPRYYRKKLGITAEHYEERIDEQRIKIIRHHLDRMTPVEMAKFLQPKVNRRMVEDFLDDKLSEGCVLELMSKLIGERVLTARKQAAYATKQKIDSVRGKL